MSTECLPKIILAPAVHLPGFPAGCNWIRPGRRLPLRPRAPLQRLPLPRKLPRGFRLQASQWICLQTEAPYLSALRVCQAFLQAAIGFVPAVTGLCACELPRGGFDCRGSRLEPPLCGVAPLCGPLDLRLKSLFS